MWSYLYLWIKYNDRLYNTFFLIEKCILNTCDYLKNLHPLLKWDLTFLCIVFLHNGISVVYRPTVRIRSAPKARDCTGYQGTRSPHLHAESYQEWLRKNLKIFKSKENRKFLDLYTWTKKQMVADSLKVYGAVWAGRFHESWLLYAVNEQSLILLVELLDCSVYGFESR
jgi:hypothetical protein